MASFSHQQQRAISPHRTMVWTEPNKPKKVAVVYYLCREDGQLEQPHFMELTSGRRLCLRDFTERLDMLRGKGMSAMYSWSSKRSYRNNGFVWHDLTEDDVIHPATTASEYVLKGSHRFNRRRGSSSSFDHLADDDHEQQQQQVVSLQDDDEISPPPPSSSSPSSGGRTMRASSLLMQLISCGSVTTSAIIKSHSSRSRPEEDPRDYFSGSLVEGKKKKKKNTTTAALKRSSSCNADTDSWKRCNKQLEENTSTLVPRQETC